VQDKTQAAEAAVIVGNRNDKQVEILHGSPWATRSSWKAEDKDRRHSVSGTLVCVSVYRHTRVPP